MDAQRIFLDWKTYRDTKTVITVSFIMNVNIVMMKICTLNQRRKQESTFCGIMGMFIPVLHIRRKYGNWKKNSTKR